MATYTWNIPSGKEINGSTKIKDTDNKISDTIDDLVDFVNGEGDHSGQGLSYDLVDKASSQTITGDKIFSGSLTGSLTGNADTATSAGACTGNSATATTLSAGADRTKLDGIEAGATNFVMPSGSIVMWNGTSANVPSGWYLCNGANGTPDLVGKFIKGSTTSGATGGSGTTSSNGAHSHTTGDHALTVGEMPSHRHSLASHTSTNSGGESHGLGYSRSDRGVAGGVASGSVVWRDTDSAGHVLVSNTGSSSSHNHGNTGSSGGHTHTIEPVHYTLCYIMKG